MASIGAVADDLTGAMTVGIMLARSRAKTAVFLDETTIMADKQITALEAIMVSSNSRALPADMAYQKVRSATQTLKDIGVRYFSKRIDTTLRGCVGIEIDAMMDVIGNDVVSIVVPSMPESKRILVGGYSIIEGQALSRTLVAQDLRTPVFESFIPRLLAGQTKRKVGLVQMDAVLKGAEVIADELNKARENDSEVIVVDGITSEDVKTISQACVMLGWNVLAVDPGPFTAKLAYCRGQVQEEESNIPNGTAEGQDLTVLIVAGSSTPITRRQMEMVCKDSRHVRISIDPIPLLEGGIAAIVECKKAVDKALNYLQDENRPRAILLETGLHGSPINLHDEDALRQLPPGSSANRISENLGRITAEILEQAGREKIAGLYVTGGDTMVSVCTQLGVKFLHVIDYVIPQTDIGRLVGKYDGLPLICKGGLTGHDHIVLDVLDRLFKEASRS